MSAHPFKHMKRSFFFSAVILATAHSLCAQSAWLPQRGQLITTPGYSYQTFDEYFAAKTRSQLPANLTQHTAFLNFEYGIFRDVAADLTLGYSRTRFRPPGSPTLHSDGLTDTQVGLRIRVLDEQTGGPWMPTVTFRVGGVIAGTYDVVFASPINPGDGANAFELSLLTGKTFGKSGFGIYADIGYRSRDNDVPDDVFGRVGVFQQLGPVTLGVGYRHVEGISGGDIGGLGFGTTYGFAQVREIERVIDAAITYTDRGGRGYQFTYSRTLSGRNTGDKSDFGFSISVPWQLGR